MSYGGRYSGGGGGGGYRRYDRVNEEDVPESKHSIFIRGLPGKMSTDEVKDYFEDKIGPVSFDFVKTSPDNSRLFVAVRFESREDAKAAMDKFADRDFLGYKCDFSWFKDIRRYAQYQSARGGGVARRGYSHSSRYGYRGNYDRDRDRRRRDSDRSRSPPSGRSRSRSKSASRSRSRSKGSAGRESRSRSRSADRSKRRERAGSEERERSKSKERSASPAEKREAGSERERHRKEKRHKRRRSASHSGNESDASTGHRRRSGRAGDRDGRPTRISSSPPPPLGPMKPKIIEDAMCIANSPSPSPPPVPPVPPPLPAPKIQINVKEKEQPPAPPPQPEDNGEVAAMIQSTTFSFTMEADDDIVVRNEKNLVFREKPPAAAPPSEETPPAPANGQAQPPPPGLPPPPAPPSFRAVSPPVARGSFRPISAVADPEEDTPPAKKERLEHEQPLFPSFSQFHPVKANNGSPVKTPRYPATAKMFADLKTFQDNIVKEIRYVPKEEGLGGLKLSSLSTLEGDDSDRAKLLTREARIAALDDTERDRFILQKRKLEAAFRNDCETFAVVTKKLLAKDPSMEQNLRLAFMETIEDLEKQFMEKIDDLLQM